MERKYIIKLKPLSPFFFGGEKTFGNKDSQNYFAVSELLPQSSSIIGLLRFLILKNNLGLGCKDNQKIIVEIGKQGFVLKDSLSAKGLDFGRLKSVSPVFITDSDDALYTRLPMDYGYMVEKSNAKVSHICNGMVDITDSEHNPFNPKTFDNWCAWAKVKDGKVAKVAEDEIFAFDERIGINKTVKSSDKDNFFKQKLVRFKGSHEFIFTATIDFEDGQHGDFMKLDGSSVKLGASSLFRIELQEGDMDWAAEFKCLNTELDKIVLLSDFFVEDFSALYKKCLYVWGESKPYRSLITDASEEHSWSNHKKSALYRVLKPGSVIFIEKGCIDETVRNEGFTKAGFNLFV